MLILGPNLDVFPPPKITKVYEINKLFGLGWRRAKLGHCVVAKVPMSSCGSKPLRRKYFFLFAFNSQIAFPDSGRFCSQKMQIDGIIQKGVAIYGAKFVPQN